ncbi:unnamed protein product [Aspergillus oryzae var. brunneus]|uniref:Unnamed protein product n=2 Tax=Aspergillus oryzae TaxID=5062 RepID=A0AAN5BRL5_ASPOZ|nr:unnamed protein product [Aspergillus oryzae]GMG52042.1 unnamed protein product [Aspergillus oryzae var. brunneus]
MYIAFIERTYPSVENLPNYVDNISPSDNPKPTISDPRHPSYNASTLRSASNWPMHEEVDFGDANQFKTSLAFHWSCLRCQGLKPCYNMGYDKKNDNNGVVSALTSSSSVHSSVKAQKEKENTT